MTLRRQLSSLAMMSAIAMIGPSTLGMEPHFLPPYDPPKPPGPPLLTPEQIKAQEKRARKAAKRAQQP